MKKRQLPFLRLTLAVLLAAASASAADATKGFTSGQPDIKSMSALAFGPDGILFIGDGRGGAVFAVDLGDTTPRKKNDPLEIKDIEAKIAAMVGTKATSIMIHDLAGPAAAVRGPGAHATDPHRDPLRRCVRAGARICADADRPPPRANN